MAGKRTYRAHKINHVDADKLRERLNQRRRITVGLDIAKRTQFAAFIDADNEELLQVIKFDSPGQDRAFVELVTQLDVEIQVALESTGSYSEVLRYRVDQAGIAVYQVATKSVHDARHIYDGVPSSHDAKAAALIGWLHNRQRSRPWPPADEHARRLRAAADHAARLEQSHRRGINQLEALVARFWPELTTLMRLTTATVLALLSEFGGPQAVADAPQPAARLMRKVGRHFLSQDKIEAVIVSAGSSVGVPMVDEEVELVRALATDVDLLRKRTKKARDRLELLAESMQAPARLAGVVGGFTAVMLVVLLGDPRDYHSAAGYLKAFGLNLTENSSGKKQGQLRISKCGPSYARTLLFLAALRLIKSDAVVKAWYERRLERNGDIAMKAIVAVMRKLTRALWAMSHNEQDFDSTRLFDVTDLGLIQSAAPPSEPSWPGGVGLEEAAAMD